VISFCVTLITWQQLPYWYAVGYLFPVLLLYGLAAMLLAFVISTVARSQLAAFAFTAGIMAVMFTLSIMTFAVSFAFRRESRHPRLLGPNQGEAGQGTEDN
jgi:ATP-binding cassette, subfamily A (ABC1), member 3